MQGPRVCHNPHAIAACHGLQDRSFLSEGAAQQSWIPTWVSGTVHLLHKDDHTSTFGGLEFVRQVPAQGPLFSQTTQWRLLGLDNLAWEDRSYSRSAHSSGSTSFRYQLGDIGQTGRLQNCGWKVLSIARTCTCPREGVSATRLVQASAALMIEVIYSPIVYFYS